MKKTIQIIFVCCLFSVFAEAQKSVTVIAEQANLRGTPSQSGAVVDEVTSGDVFELITKKGAWYLVQTDAYVGWLHGNTIQLGRGGAGSSSSGSGGNQDLLFIDDQPSPRPSNSRRTKTKRSSGVSSSGGGGSYIRGPRGGCYYINSNGNKTYVNRSLCN